MMNNSLQYANDMIANNRPWTEEDGRKTGINQRHKDHYFRKGNDKYSEGSNQAILRTPQHSTIITAEGPLYPEIMNAPKGEHRNLKKNSESSHAMIKYGTAETTVPNYAYLCIHCDTLQTKVKKP